MARIRTFIAVAVGKEIRRRLIALQESLARSAPEVKWVEPENLHVTLLFLGEVGDREVPEVCRIVADCVLERAPFSMSVEGVGCFPDLRRPRILWAGIGEGASDLTAIHDALEGPLEELGYRREERRYTPHLTLGRAKSDLPADEVAAALARRSTWSAGSQPVDEVVVMSSELRSSGPVYVPLSRVKLGG